MNVVVTHHAARRFQERHAPHLSVDIAKRTLAESFQTAGKLRARTHAGDEQWRLDEPRCVVVTKRDPDGTIAIITVLPAQDLLGLPEEAIDRLHEIAGLHRSVAQAAALVEREIEAPPSTSRARREERIANAVEALRAQLEAAETGLREDLEGMRTHAKNALAGAERMRRHAEGVEEDRRRMKAALRVVLRAIVLGEASDEAAIEEVRAIEPDFLSPGFLGR